jgi:hypothetical protein
MKKIFFAFLILTQLIFASDNEQKEIKATITQVASKMPTIKSEEYYGPATRKCLEHLEQNQIIIDHCITDDNTARTLCIQNQKLINDIHASNDYKRFR